VINLSSAAQAPVNLQALAGKGGELGAMEVYAQSKLAIIMWSFAMAALLGNDGPVIVAVNPDSLLASILIMIEKNLSNPIHMRSTAKNTVS